MTKEAICEYRIKNPCLTLQAIGDEFGITRERVRQILSRENLPTRHYIPKKKCIECGKDIYRHLKFCSKACWGKYTQIPLSCKQCGKLYYRRAKEIVWHQEHQGIESSFCSKYCQGAWAGRHYGFKAHPENQKLRWAKRNETATQVSV